MTTQTIADRRSRRLDQILTAAWAIATEAGLGAVSLHEVARRVQMQQPSLYGYVSSKLDLFDAMFAQAYEQLLSRLDAVPPAGNAREQLLQLSRTVLDFVVDNPPRQQLLFQRTIPGFEPSPASYALARRLTDRCAGLLAALGADTPAHLEVYTAVLAGLGSQQVANDPGGDRWTRHLEAMLAIFIDHFVPPEP
ncbi:DNA-binding transcriptional regulator, AcrR family [Nakamurella panacisegetis]|uniref:DNA-binding transcriptional regulator, AcrR family n=1 Tax=Nakamurella panacisegetis TaxID=1090615 RepID=A0A1H0QBY4_9ACTN|nr:TetR/AcrR family transcriptional regulator [Nakamurella panacisegetis]SDP14710.1 DNA-binding transcriptional regulator, AcrR family [Nakamurella panacisegetis]